MISVEEALARVLAPLKPVGTEVVPIAEAHGRVLAIAVSATISHPPAPVSAMDGYAVRAADIAAVPASLELVGESRAGVRYPGTLGPGETVRIFTGAVMPDGADTVAIQENATFDGGRITINETASHGTFVRAAGLDIEVGDRLVDAGTRLTARDVALISSTNIAEVTVYREPVIAILATGDELVMPGEELGADQIVSSNSVALAGYIRAFGGKPRSLGIARDDSESLGAALAELDDVDMLITIGGASVGDYDLVASELGARGLEINFNKIAMRPGKPMISGRFGDVPMLGLPGNPVSVGVTSLLFVGPAVGVLAGTGPVRAETGRARLGRDLGANDRREEYLRADLEIGDDGEPVATPVDRQDSAMFAKFAHAGCLVKRAPFAEAAASGSWVDIVYFPAGPLRF
ncbi:MAG: molybdopterin molybdotransferase MoeA [Rhodospirillales bacterium]